MLSRRRVLAVPVLPALAALASSGGAAVAAAVRAPSKPRITRVGAGEYIDVTFAVADDGGRRWTRIQARGFRIEDGRVVGRCTPPPLASGGKQISYYPTGPGRWASEIRVRNSAGWSPWSARSEAVDLD